MGEGQAVVLFAENNEDSLGIVCVHVLGDLAWWSVVCGRQCSPYKVLTYVSVCCTLQRAVMSETARISWNIYYFSVVYVVCIYTASRRKYKFDHLDKISIRVFIERHPPKLRLPMLQMLFHHAPFRTTC